MKDFTPDVTLCPSEIIEECVDDVAHLVIKTMKKYDITMDKAIQFIDLTIKLMNADYVAKNVLDAGLNIERIEEALTRIEGALESV